MAFYSNVNKTSGLMFLCKINSLRGVLRLPNNYKCNAEFKTIF